MSELAFVATDLWRHYRDGVHSVFPNVAVVADRFHVVQNLHKVIHEERRRAQESASTDEEKKKLKGVHSHSMIISNQLTAVSISGI